VIDSIFVDVENHIKQGDLIKDYKMSALPLLYDHLVKLIKCLVIFHILSRPNVDTTMNNQKP
jgi:hypothetical protein